MDEHVEAAITNELRNRGIDVLTIQDDGRRRLVDRAVLSRRYGTWADGRHAR